mmetsp:Transcript_37375/g.80987  ORF Transcript_37375/g.80987 Transcript_37375/m.80987 type:complete len:231 (+) Transcript_37375:110-802(+)
MALRGNASTTLTTAGSLYLARRCAPHSRNAATVSDSGSVPSLGTTSAATFSPYSSSASPNTATSSTPSCSRNSRSMSNADTLNPAVLMMSTELRPRMANRLSALLLATSPVWNHPSSSNASAVASCRFQYSRKTVSPLIWRSPGVSVPVTSTPSSTIRADTPGRGAPTSPSRLSFGSNGLDRAMPISVIPYRSRRRCPDMSSHRRNTEDGNALLPLTMSRRARAAEVKRF